LPKGKLIAFCAACHYLRTIPGPANALTPARIWLAFRTSTSSLHASKASFLEVRWFDLIQNDAVGQNVADLLLPVFTASALSNAAVHPVAGTAKI
jgi:hypothetical protein